MLAVISDSWDLVGLVAQRVVAIFRLECIYVH